MQKYGTDIYLTTMMERTFTPQNLFPIFKSRRDFALLTPADLSPQVGAGQFALNERTEPNRMVLNKGMNPRTHDKKLSKREQKKP